MRSSHALGLHPAATCRRLTLEEARRVPAIPSGYSTDRAFRVTRRSSAGEYQWSLDERQLPVSLHKHYDSGGMDEWLESYLEAAPLESLRFLGVEVDGEIGGLVTWRPLEWNETLWLIDIRVRDRARRRGLGSSLISALQQIARDDRVRGVHVETQTSNYPAVRFYRSHGFEPSGFNDHLYTNRDAEEGQIALFLFWENQDFSGSAS
jgi:ribosomal protein S18 acetylase RimI-like enzyme